MKAIFQPATGRALLVHTAVDLDNGIYAHPGPDYASGYGRLDVQRAIDLLPHHLESDVTHDTYQEYTLTIAQTR